MKDLLGSVLFFSRKTIIPKDLTTEIGITRTMHTTGYHAVAAKRPVVVKSNVVSLPNKVLAPALVTYRLHFLDTIA